MLVIGRSKKPYCFGNHSTAALGFNYHSNPKAWMSTEIFFEWLKSFDEFIRTTRDRSVALLVDNASCHGSRTTLPSLKKVTVIFLPANTTSFLQRLDASMIASIKRRFRRQQVLSALNSEDPAMKLLYNVDQLTAMKWIREIWQNLDSTIIFNCWMKTGLISNNVNRAQTDDIPALCDPEKNEIIEFLKRSLPVQHHDELDTLLQPSDD